MAPLPLVKVLIVDDSAVMRTLLRSVILSDSRLEVVATANDGLAALSLLDTIHPDIILLDVEMPVMDGLSTLRKIRSSGRRIPVIICSALTQRGAHVTIEALASGAADYVTKPSSQSSREAATGELAREVIPKILALTRSAENSGKTGLSSREAIGSLNPVTRLEPSIKVPVRSWSPNAPPAGHHCASAAPRPPNLSTPLTVSSPQVVLIGVSTGGPAALDVLLPKLPANFPVPILIVQHMPNLFTKMLAERLDARCPLHVIEAADGDQPTPGVIHIAKGDWHLSLSPRTSPASTSSALGPVLRLTQAEPENHCRPAVDVLFRSAVTVYGSRILAVILTGMGSDGLDGCRLIRQHGGVVLAQDQPSSAVWGMPGVVANAGLAQRVLPLDQIAAEILRLTSQRPREALALREPAV